MCDQQRLRPACAYAQSDQSLCYSLEYYMNTKLLPRHHLECLSLKGGCTGSSESIHVKMPHWWKSRAAAHMINLYFRWWQVPYFWAGIKMYDLVSGKQLLRRSYYLRKTKALELFPMLKKDQLKGALVYYDGKNLLTF